MSFRRTIVGLAVSAALLLAFSGSRGAQKNNEFIWISDLHFDPTANPALMDKLAEATVEQWPQILQSSPAAFSRFGEDTTWTLLSSAFDAIRKAAPQAEFTVVTGDVLVHHFREKYESAAKHHDNDSFRRFATKSLQFVAEQLATLSPGKPVLLALGNNDSECGDYQLQPHGAFLKDASAGISKLLGPLANDTSLADWSALGSYSVPHPTLKGYRLIAVNSVYFSPRYTNACSAGEPDPAEEEMRWLGRKLADAKAGKEKVWLIFHIAPGIDGYATSHPRGGGTEKKVVPMWKPVYTEQFQKLMAAYGDVVIVSLAGHEHTDDFRLFGQALVLMTPGLSPVVRQNPAFRSVEFQSDGRLSDATTYYLSNLDNLSSGATPDWKLEYNFGKAWGFHQLDAKSFGKLRRELQRQPEAREQWSSFYSVSHPEGSTITKQTFSWIFCATGNATEDSYKACLQEMEPEGVQ